MPDLYSQVAGINGKTFGENAKRVLTASDNTGPETTWLLVYSSDGDWEGGESENVNPELTDSNGVNYQAIVECIQSYCEVYEVVRPDWGTLAIKVRDSSVPYAAGESRADRGQNTILTALVQAHPDLGASHVVWNGRIQGRTVNYD